MSLSEEWSKAFKTNQSLKHLDISHNNLDSRELIEMKVGLDQNHTILGIHLQGNEGTVDALGFFNPFHADGNQEQEDIGLHSLLTRI